MTKVQKRRGVQRSAAKPKNLCDSCIIEKLCNLPCKIFWVDSCDQHDWALSKIKKHFGGSAAKARKSLEKYLRSLATTPKKKGEAMTKTQKELARTYGTPEQFEMALYRAYTDLMITQEEMAKAVIKYRDEWAGKKFKEG